MEPVIVDLVRTPFGKREGWLSGLHAAELLGRAQRAVIERSDLDPGVIDQAIGGCVTPIGEQFGNVTRTAWMHAGLPHQTGCTTIDAQCSTAQQAVALLAGQVAIGAVDAGVACGVELMSRVPLTPKVGTGFGTPRPADWSIEQPDQYEGADRIARAHGIDRGELDAFGLRSQLRARAAWDAGRFDAHVVPVDVPDGEGGTTRVTRDQGLRETSMDALAGLRPVKDDGLHTAGTSSQVSDGASAALVTSRRRAQELGLRPRARIVGHATIGGDTEVLLGGTVDASRRVLDRAGMTLDDVDVIEVNEAFASVPMSFARAHGIDDARCNPNGGAIAVGHPTGATGIRLLATALDELERIDGQLALIAICASAATTCLLLERC